MAPRAASSGQGTARRRSPPLRPPCAHVGVEDVVAGELVGRRVGPGARGGAGRCAREEVREVPEVIRRRRGARRGRRRGRGGWRRDRRGRLAHRLPLVAHDPRDRKEEDQEHHGSGEADQAGTRNQAKPPARRHRRGYCTYAQVPKPQPLDPGFRARLNKVASDLEPSLDSIPACFATGRAGLPRFRAAHPGRIARPWLRHACGSLALCCDRRRAVRP